MKRLLLPIFFALFVFALLLIGPETPAEDPEQDTSSIPVEEAPRPPAGDEDLETFVPTEKLTADSAISFPVDI